MDRFSGETEMNQTEFDKVVASTVESINQLLRIKGGEYAGSEDRLANFKRGAELTGVTPLQCLFIYLSKHYDSVSTYIRDQAAGIDRPRSESIAGRLDDIINYCILAKALVQEHEAARAKSATYEEEESRKRLDLSFGTVYLKNHDYLIWIANQMNNQSTYNQRSWLMEKGYKILGVEN